MEEELEVSPVNNHNKTKFYSPGTDYVKTKVGKNPV